MAWLDDFFGNLLKITSGGVATTQRSILNFTGTGVTVADDPSNARTNVTITAGTSSGGSTTLSANFTQPVADGTTTVLAIVASGTAAVKNGPCQINDAGTVSYYQITNISGNNLTLLNNGVTGGAAPTSTVHSGAVVTFGGLPVPQTATILGEGQALFSTAGNYAPGGAKKVLNVRSGYGGLKAVGDRTTDDTAAIQACCDTVQSTTAGAVYLPETSTKSNIAGLQMTLYKITQPIFVDDTSLSTIGNSVYDFFGECKTRVGFDTYAFCGPAVICGAAITNAVYTTEGNGVVTVQAGTSNTSQTFVDLGEYWHGDIDGLGLFSFSMWFWSVDAGAPNVNNPYVLAESFGNLQGLETHNAFRLVRINNTGTQQLQAVLQTTGGLLSATWSTDMSASTLHRVMVTFDKRTLRLYVDTALVASSSTLGADATIVQKFYEEFVIGQGGFVIWPSSGSPRNAVGTSVRWGLARIDNQCLATGGTCTASPSTDRTGVSGQTQIIVDFGAANTPSRVTNTDWVIARSWTAPPGGAPLTNHPVWLRLHTAFFTYTGNLKIHDFAVAGYGGSIYFRSQLYSFCDHIFTYQCCRGITIDDYTYAVTLGSGLQFQSCAGSKSGYSAEIIQLNGSQFISLKDGWTSNGSSVNVGVLIGFGDIVIYGGGFPNGFRQAVYAFAGQTKSVKGMGLAWSDEGVALGYCGIIFAGCQFADITLASPSQTAGKPLAKVGIVSNNVGQSISIRGASFCTDPMVFFGSNQNYGLPVEFNVFNSPTTTAVVDSTAPGPVVFARQETYGVNTLVMPSDADYSIPTNGELWGEIVVTCASLGGTVALANGSASITFSVNQTLANGTSLVFSLPGTASVTNGSTAVTFSTSQTTTGAATIVFAAQPGVVYTTTGALSGTSGTLTAAYTGPTNSATGMTFGTVYTLSGAVTGSTAGTLSAVYAGTTNATATTTYALSATRKISTPYRVAGKRWRVQNFTMGAQTINFIGPTGAGFQIAAGATSVVRDDGTNMITA